MKKLFNAMLLCVTFGALFACSEGEFDDSNDNTTVEYTVSIKTNGNGSVSFEGYTEPFISVASGTTITILATPDEGYEFVGWRIDETAAPANLGLSYTFEVSGDIALTAVFEKEEVTM